jgi:hypothetical protein
MKGKRKSTDPIRALFSLYLVLLSSSGLTQVRASSDDVVHYTIQKPDEVQRGKTFQITVLFSVQSEWYIYAPTGNNAALGMIETNVLFALPKGITRAGKIKFPEPHFKNGYEVYDGKDITMCQALLASPSLTPGQYEIKGKVTWQTCNADICLPPVTEEIITLIKVK